MHHEGLQQFSSAGTEQLQNIASSGGLSPSAWLWIIIGVVIVGFIIYNLIKKGGNKK